MRCHLPKFAVFLATSALAPFALIVGSSAYATINFVNPTYQNSNSSNVILPPNATTNPGASPVPGASPPPAGGVTTATFYFSNITGNTDGATPIPNYIADGTKCNPNVNPHCHNATDLFTITVTSSAAVTNAATMWLAFCPNQTLPAAGSAIGTCTPIASQPYVNGAEIPALSAPWSKVCASFGGTVGTVDINCLATDHTNHSAQLFLIADVNDSGTVSGEVLGFTVWIAGNIPKLSSNGSETGSAGPSGLYDFFAFPGDQKIHILGPNGAAGPLVDANFPTEPGGVGNGVGIGNVNWLFVSSQNTTFDPSGAEFNTISIDTPATVQGSFQTGVNAQGQLGTYAITSNGIQDGIRYYVRASLIDNAGNIGYMTTDTDGVNHSCVPDEVVGLLADNGHCFIATAAFGTPLAKQVKVLREFRDKYLLTTRMGSRFVRWYYTNSPPYANFIAHHENLRAAARTFLYPLVGFGWLAMKWGPANAFLLTITLLLLPLLIFQYRRFKNRTQIV